MLWLANYRQNPPLYDLQLPKQLPVPSLLTPLPDNTSLASSSSQSIILSAPPTFPPWRPIPTVSARVSFAPQLGDGGQNITLCFKVVDAAGQAARGAVSLQQAAMGAGLCVQVAIVSCIYRQARNHIFAILWLLFFELFCLPLLASQLSSVWRLGSPWKSVFIPLVQSTRFLIQFYRRCSLVACVSNSYCFGA